jgi:hypothetical protein
MPDALLLAAAALLTVAGMGWLALAMDVHWNQVYAGAVRSGRAATVSRCLGSGALTTSLVLCLLADTATMAVLVWMMLLGLSAAVITFLLSWRPSALAPLAAWSAGAPRRD